MIIPCYYEDLNILHENTMPSRSYYIPASVRMDELAEHRELSDRFQLLNGIWQFQFFKSIYDVKDEFYKNGYDSSAFDEIAVPGVWQMAGYDSHQYTNIRYPFPFDPPYVPQDNPCGAYIHTFTYKKNPEAPRAFLNFEGVDSCYYVWLNGTYVGYSQVSHATGEFEVTHLLQEGENTLAVLVLKWCDGSYLEDQDKFRMSGIFRDVYLLKRPENVLWDYHITTKVKENQAQVSIKALLEQAQKKTEKADLDAQMTVQVSIEDISGQVIAEGTFGKKDSEIRDGGRVSDLTLSIQNPILWNTEHPYLYTIILSTEKEVIVDHIALRTIEIVDKVLLFNGEKIKFRGVNRHDSDPVTGYVVDPEHIKRDLTLMKQHNFNAIRSSHYPNAPYFYQMCEKYGFMVIDEADIEAHGPFSLQRKEDTEYHRYKRWNEALADHPDWEQSIVDRVQRMVQRDKNRFCIVMWSMGNESAYGCNFEKALAWTKAFDPARLTQYESARYRYYDVTYDYKNLDLYSRMYPSLDEIRTYLEKDGSKPFLLVEYCHSMGNGPGDLEDYFQLIQSDDRMCGGFVWEWCDHAVDHGTAENEKTIYYYGGDHGEQIHDGDFCVDGLVYPDRRPHTAVLEYKNVYRPVRVVSYDQESGELILHNYLDFDDLKDYLEISYEVTQDGQLVVSGVLEDVSVAPHSDGKVRLQVSVPSIGRVYLKLIYGLKKEIPLLAAGYELGFDEIMLKNEDGRNQRAVKWMTGDSQRILYSSLQMQETDREIMIKGDDFVYKINKRTGLFEQLEYGGKSYLNHPMEVNIWRAPTDNDMYIRAVWKKAYYDRTYIRAYEVQPELRENSAVIKVKASLAADSVQPVLRLDMMWKIASDGRIQAVMQAVKDEEFPTLPRFGIRLFLKKELGQVRYYGMGPQESYVDKHRSASHGQYESAVKELHEDYIYPQENGSHYDCDFVEISGDENGLAAVSEKSFSFNASVYTQEELERAAHNYELTESDSTVLCLDYAQNGIGSNSCGPEVQKQYRFDQTSFTFDITLVPYQR